MQQPKIVITGGTGFAGSHLVEALLEEGYTNIHVTSISGTNKFVASLIGADHIHVVDLTSQEQTSEFFKTVRPEQVYHLASLAFVAKSFEEADLVLSNNIAVQKNVLTAVKEHCPTARILAVGSAEEYGISISDSEIPITEDHPFRPINPYAVSKIAQDMLGYSYHISYGLDIVTVRPFNHIGERQSTDFAIPAFAKQIVAIEHGDQDGLEVGNLSAIRDFTDVKDMARAYSVAMNKGLSGQVYNIGSGIGMKMSDVVSLLVSFSTTSIELIQQKSRFRPHDIPIMIANSDRIKALGWSPTIELRQTLQRTLEWYRKQYKQEQK